MEGRAPSRPTIRARRSVPLQMKKKRAATKSVYSLADLQNWSEADPPIRLGVLGDPVEHSLSPQMQNAALKHDKIEMQYSRFHIAPNELGPALKRLRELEFIGVNLTLPHKVAAPEFVDWIDDDSKQIGAINVIKFSNDKARGFNTDGRGFARR